MMYVSMNHVTELHIGFCLGATQSLSVYSGALMPEVAMVIRAKVHKLNFTRAAVRSYFLDFLLK